MNDTGYFLAAHSDSNFLSANFSPISDVGEPNNGVVLQSLVNAALKPTVVTYIEASLNYPVAQAELLFAFGVSADDAVSGVLMDPGSSYKYVLQEKIGSPFLTSIDLPTINGLGSYKLQYEVGSNWFNLAPFLGGTSLQLPGGVDGVEFDPLSVNGQPFLLPDGFLFELTFSGPGTFSADLTEPIAPVPEPSTWAMLLIGFAAIGFAARRRLAAPLLVTKTESAYDDVQGRA